MTDGQIKYQNLMENQRHNLQMERIGEDEVRIKRQQNSLKAGELGLKEREVVTKEYLTPYQEYAYLAKGMKDEGDFLSNAVRTGVLFAGL